MRQNQYDDPVFFEKYAQMTRSQEGLSGAGEWPALEAMMPDLHGKRMLDLGCGYGWHCAYALTKAARSVIGVDISEKMLAVAREKISDSRAKFIRCAIEELPFPDRSFDVVFSSLALHYIADLRAVYARVSNLLVPGGVFLFSCEHPLFTAQGPQDWVYDSQGNIDHFPVDRYFEEGMRNAQFLGETLIKYHRTLTTILNSLLECGFTLERVVEPQPTQEMLRRVPSMRDELRRPMMLLIRARSPL